MTSPSASMKLSHAYRSGLGIDIFTYISLFFLVGVGVASLLSDYSGDLANTTRYFALLIGVVAVVLRNPKVVDLGIWLIVLGGSYYIALRSGKMTVFFTVAMIVLVHGYPIRKVMNAFFASVLIDFAIILAFSVLGILEPYSFKDGERVLCLGLVSPNTLGCLSFTILCMIEYYLGPKRRLLAPLLIVYAFVWFGLTASRTPFAISLILIVVCAVMRDSWGKCRVARWFCAITVVFSVLSVGLVVLYANGNPVAHYLDGLLSGRLVMNSTYNYEVFGIPILGEAPNGIYSSTVDNVYLYLLFRCGLVGLALYNIYYFFLLDKARREDDPIFFVLCLLLAVYGLTESTSLLSTCLNPTLLLLCTLPGRKDIREGCDNA